MKKEESIGIFDSGIGGVTVLKEIIKILPNENYIYYSDSKNNPYGDKKDEEIIEICDKIVSNFIKQKCKAIVIACNTASAKAAKTLREKYPEIPIIAIEPAYKMVHDFAYDQVTLVMATNAEFEPYEYHEGDAIVGIDVDMSQAICDKIGYKFKVEDMEFDSILPAVAAGKADFGAAGMTVTDERKENADFTDTYANASQVVIV